jgi:hypothetical protein
VARRLHHCRDLGESEPFDFLTWFEYSRLMSRALTGFWPNSGPRWSGSMSTEKSTSG